MTKPPQSAMPHHISHLDKKTGPLRDDSISLSCFKSSLKTYLFKQAYPNWYRFYMAQFVWTIWKVLDNLFHACMFLHEHKHHRDGSAVRWRYTNVLYITLHYCTNPHCTFCPSTTLHTSYTLCSLNLLLSYARSILPRHYTIIYLLSFHHCSSQPSQYPSISSRAYTRLLNESIEKQRFSPVKRHSQSGTCLFNQSINHSWHFKRAN